MKIKIVGRAFIIKFLTAAMLTLVAQFQPDALVLKDAKGNALFKVSLTKGMASISVHGISFNDTDAEGIAQLTGNFPNEVDNADREAWVTDQFAAAFTHANELEAQIRDAYVKVSDLKNTIKAATTVE